jgi:hypothetical protein
LRRPELADVSEDPSPPPRHVQARIWVDGKTRTWNTFVAHRDHQVEVSIGPRDDASAIVDNDVVNERVLPPTDDGAHLLTITFFEPRSMKRPQVSTTLLPASGHTAPCRFNLRVAPDAEVVEARITVLHENRVIHTSVLTGPVTDFQNAVFPDNPPEQPLIRLSFIVSVPHASLSERQRFDAAFVVNNLADEAYLTATRGNQSWAVNLSGPDVPDLRRTFAELLERRWHSASLNGLRADETTKLLVSLARHGSLLRTFIVEGSNMNVDGIRKLQVVVVHKGDRLPLEFIYDFPSPADGASVCPKAEESLESGQCRCNCRELPTPSPYVCPLGFWLFNRVIEWHVFDQELARRANGADFLIEVAEVRKSAPIEVPGQPLVGYSKQLEKILNPELPEFCIDALRKRYPNVHVVDSWSGWKATVQEAHPSVLVLLTHTVPGTKEKIAGIELGPPDVPKDPYDALLPLDYLTDDYLRASKDGVSPIVFLLGCKTDTASDPLAKISNIFQAKRAAIVITTNSDMYGQLAGRIAETCLDYLSRFSSADESFGDIMLRVRRHLLLEGVSMVLCVSAYGDADWRLRPSTASGNN